LKNLPTNEKQSRVAEETVLTNRKPENIAKIVHNKEAVNIINPNLFVQTAGRNK
jgi:hypothetical protein